MAQFLVMTFNNVILLFLTILKGILYKDYFGMPYYDFYFRLFYGIVYQNIDNDILKNILEANFTITFLWHTILRLFKPKLYLVTSQLNVNLQNTLGHIVHS